MESSLRPYFDPFPPSAQPLANLIARRILNQTATIAPFALDRPSLLVFRYRTGWLLLAQTLSRPISMISIAITINFCLCQTRLFLPMPGGYRCALRGCTGSGVVASASLCCYALSGLNVWNAARRRLGFVSGLIRAIHGLAKRADSVFAIRRRLTRGQTQPLLS